MRVRLTVLAALAAAALPSLAAPPGSFGQKRGQDRPLRHDAAAVVKLIPVRVLDADGRP